MGFLFLRMMPMGLCLVALRAAELRYLDPILKLFAVFDVICNARGGVSLF